MGKSLKVGDLAPNFKLLSELADVFPGSQHADKLAALRDAMDDAMRTESEQSE